MPHLLLVDDDFHVRRAIAKYLRQQGWEVTVAGSAEEAIDLVGSWQPDAVLLDWGLPGMSGRDLVVHWRSQSRDFPVILLTARSGLEDLIAGLEAGADDYLRKPCYPEELLARLRVRLRSRSSAGAVSCLHLEGCEVDLELQQVARGGVLQRLTTREVELLSYLARRPGVAVSRDELHREIWGFPTSVVTRSADNVVRRLRTKIELEPARPRHIITVHGVGYRFVP